MESWHHILVTKGLTIREAVLTTIQNRLSNVIIENDSQLATRGITRDIKALTPISNLVEGIRALAKVKDLKFRYCNRSANWFADMIAK